MYGPTNSDDDVHVDINAALPGTASHSLDGTSSWQWRVTGAINITAAQLGNRYVSVWMQTDGVKVDAIVVSRQNATAPTETRGAGGTWSYATNATTSQAGVCNDDGYDTDAGLAGDQDDLLVGGDRASCYAAWPAAQVNDLSGNVKGVDPCPQPGRQPDPRRRVQQRGQSITRDSRAWARVSMVVPKADTAAATAEKWPVRQRLVMPIKVNRIRTPPVVAQSRWPVEPAK